MSQFGTIINIGENSILTRVIMIKSCLKYKEFALDLLLTALQIPKA